MHLRDPVGQLQDAVVLVDQVEGLAPYSLQRRGQQVDVGVDGVPDVQQGPPGLAVAVDGDQPLGPGVEGEGVHHQIEAHPRRQPEDRPFAQDHRAEARVGLGQPQQLDLGQPLGLAVVAGRGEGHVLGQQLDLGLAAGWGVVDGAGRGVEEAVLPPLASRPLGHGLGQTAGGVDVALAVEGRGEIGGRVVGEPGQVDHRPDAVQPARIELAQVALDHLQPLVGRKGHPEPAGVDHPHRLPQRQQLRHQHAPDVPRPAGHQDHSVPPQAPSDADRGTLRRYRSSHTTTSARADSNGAGSEHRIARWTHAASADGGSLSAKIRQVSSRRRSSR